MIRLLPATAEQCAPIIYWNMRNNPIVPPGTTVKDVERLLYGWTTFGIFEDANLIGVVSLNGDRLHLDLAPDWQGKWNPRAIARQALTLLFQTRESLFTSIEENNTRAIRLAEGVGFMEVGRSDGYLHYCMHRSEQRHLQPRARSRSTEGAAPQAIS